MVTCVLKLKLNSTQERTLEQWLWRLTGAYNWALRKLELDANDGIYHSTFDLNVMLNEHGPKVGIPAQVLRATVGTAHGAWQRCYSRASKRPKMKSQRNRLRSIPFPCGLVIPKTGPIPVLGLGKLRFHKQEIPAGRIKCYRILSRPSGWYLALTIDSSCPTLVQVDQVVGIDPGFTSLLSLSNGEKVAHPRELEKGARRLAQSQRGRDRQLTQRLREREANRRRDRNHKLSRRLVEENQVIVFSKDNIKGLSSAFGKSVASSSHSQLRSMLAYKCRAGGRQYIEVPSRNSTKTCSACGSLSGPTGYVGLKVRHWQCDACGADHDRDINAAINTLIVGLGLSHERYREVASENLDSVGGSHNPSRLAS